MITGFQQLCCFKKVDGAIEFIGEIDCPKDCVNFKHE
jgi:hypothetical protein